MASSNTVLRYILSAEYSDIDRLPTSPSESCSEHEDPYEARSITSEKKCARPTLLNLSGFISKDVILYLSIVNQPERLTLQL